MKPEAGCPPGAFAKAAHLSVQAVCEKLRGCDDYDPLFLTDEEMGIDAFGESLGGVRFLTF